MKRAKIISELIDNNHNSKKEFSKKIGMKYTTLMSILSRGVSNASIDNIIQICRGLNITVDGLQEMANLGFDKTILSDEEKRLIEKYRKLTDEQKVKLEGVLDSYEIDNENKKGDKNEKAM